MLELFGCLGNAGALATEDVRRTDDDRKAEFVAKFPGAVHVVRDARLGHVEADLDHGLFELVTVLSSIDGNFIRADELDVVSVEDARTLQVHRQVQRRLAAKRRKQCVWLLLGNDRFEHRYIERLDIGLVGEIRIGHDRGRVRVGQDDSVALFEQDPARLSARVVELTGLANNDRA